MIDHHVLAAISLGGVVLDFIGGLYLAYDLLGGKRGPLRALTRAATYSLLFGLGYGLPLGPVYGLVAGAGLGLALGLEFWVARTAPGRQMPLPALLGFAILRGGTAQGLASALTFNARFGTAFGLLSIVGLALTYILGFSPSREYQPDVRPRLTRRRLVATCVRGLVIGAAGALAGAVTHEGARGTTFGLEIGLVVATVGAVVATISPYIEWWADALPTRRLGVFGAVLLLLGFALQSVQYWAALLDVRIR
ncbi:MAG TPA: hypothetical protein VKZ50_06625 [bacterium]|nr:hypothetical protein [bacterium]